MLAVRTVRCLLLDSRGHTFRCLIIGLASHSIIGLVRAEKALNTVTGTSLGPFLAYSVHAG